VIGPIFPKGGGVGTVDHVLLTCSLNNRFEMLLLNTSRTKAGDGKDNSLALINLYYYFTQLSRLLWILLFQRPQIVHQSVTDGIAFFKETSFLLAARLSGAKTVAHMHGNLDAEINQSSPVRKRLIRAALSVPHRIIVLHKYLRTFLYEKESPSLNISVVPNSIDSSIAMAMESLMRQNQAGCLVISLGWVGGSKGLFDVLRAAPLVRAQYPQIRFVFAGALERRVTEEMIQRAVVLEGVQDIVSFPGLITGKQRLDLLAQAQVLILPSYHENLPVSILEGMAMGLPVVASAVGGIPEIVEEGRNGYLIQPGDFQALADRILMLARNPSLRQTIGQSNRQRVRREYLPDIFAARIAEVYQDLIRS